MPRLIYKGDTVNNFGTHLPAPFIERVYIEDGYLNVTVNLYIMTSEDDTDISTLLTRLADISYYIAVVPSRKGETYSELNAGTLNIFSSMYSADFCGTTDFRYAYPYIGEGLTFENYSWNTSHASDDEYWYTETTAFNARTTDNEEGEYPTEEAEYALQVADDHNVEDYWAALRVLDSDTYVNPNGKEGTLTGRPLLNPDGAASYVQLSFDDFGDSVDTVYDSQGNKILVYSYTTDDELHHIAPDDGSDGNGNYYFSAYEEWTNLNVYTFSSFLDWSNDSDNIEDMMTDNVSLLNQNISDVSYEKLFEDGVIAGQAEQMWMDPNGDPFDGTSLQEIMQRYHKPTKITHKQIVARFQDLIERFDKPLKPRRRGRPPLSKLTKKLGGRSFPSPTGSFQLPEDLQDVIDNLNYVLIEYAEEPDLLPRLNELRKAWPNKSSTNRVGKLYNAFKKTLNDANKAVIGEPLLTKQLVLNPKIIDARVTPQADWSQRERWLYDGSYYEVDELTSTITDSGEQYLPIDAEVYPSEFIYGGWKLGAETFYTSDADTENDLCDALKINGYIFFDQEKYIHRCSVLSNVYDTQKIDSLFGTDLINSRIRPLQETSLIRRLSNDKGATQIDTEYDPEWSEGDGPWSTTVTATTPNSSVTGYPNHQYLIGDDGETLYSYCVLRNFNFAAQASDTDTQEMNDNYRLMMFEFQDLTNAPDEDTLYELASEDDELPWYYEFNFQFNDNTKRVYQALKSNYNRCKTGSFEEYYDLASEACNYNNIDGKFNEFFIDGIEAAYAGMPGETPWIRAPLLFNLHRDLLFNTFDGDWTQIVSSTKTMSDRISPYGGTLDSLESFRKSFQSLYDDYYDTDTGNTPEALMGTYAYKNEISLDSEYSVFPYYYDGTTAQTFGKWNYVEVSWATLEDFQETALSTRNFELDILSKIEYIRETGGGMDPDDDAADSTIVAMLETLMADIDSFLFGTSPSSSMPDLDPDDYIGLDNLEALHDWIWEWLYNFGDTSSTRPVDSWIDATQADAAIENANMGWFTGIIQLALAVYANRYVDGDEMEEVLIEMLPAADGEYSYWSEGGVGWGQDDFYS